MHTTTASHITPAQPPPTRFAPRCTKGTQSAILAGFFFLALLSTATAADFSGNLKGVTITDAENTNKPPVAAFTYFINGNTISFDASGSTDPDGNITKYKWDFGNGLTSEGLSSTYTLTSTADLQVTLIVTDNNNGVALSHQSIISTRKSVADNFSNNTVENYTTINGKISIYAGVLHGATAWTSNIAYHETPTGSNDHFVQGDIQSSPDGSGGLIGLRCNGTTGYFATIYEQNINRIVFSKFNGSKVTFVANVFAPSMSLVSGNAYTVKITASGSTFHFYVDLNMDGDFLDAGEDLGTITDTTYSTGQYLVIGARVGVDPSVFTVDNLSGGTL